MHFFVVILLFLWACTNTNLKIYNGLFLLGCKGFICWVGIPRSGRFVVELEGQGFENVGSE